MKKMVIALVVIVVSLFILAWRANVVQTRQRQQRIASESYVVTVLRQYLNAQGVYHRTDYDNDGLKEYAADMACLYDWDGPGGAEPIRLVDLATATAHYSLPESGRLSGYDGVFSPRLGYYYTELQGNLEDKKYQVPVGDKGVPGWKDGFGLVAFPAIYKRTGTYCFIINEEGTVYQKDIKGLDLEHLEKLPRYWPSDLKKEGWKMTGE
jgi:hypothetical protein